MLTGAFGSEWPVAYQTSIIASVTDLATQADMEARSIFMEMKSGESIVDLE